MARIFKNFLIILGSLLIGFGMGMIVANFLILGGVKYWLAIVISLVLGGFLIAQGLMMKKRLKIKEEEKKRGGVVVEGDAQEKTEK